ncbi:outer membrane protein insertion porin family [Sphingomonas prati]|uniref:Outer membrane protein assembly factor BamA n=2 Tax=Sphingomonas prati TaxID=1843237 RepID=A0A7W9BR12_9SPHN|nr:outer membrane protein insertion porin family [Sphingomonas prati]
MTVINNHFGRRSTSVFLLGTILGGTASMAGAQTPAPAGPRVPPTVQPTPGAAGTPAAAAPSLAQTRIIRSLSVTGAQRLEPETVRSYVKLRVGETYTTEQLDQAIKDLYATQLFADATIVGAETGNIVLQVRENPVINRIVFEGNKRLKEDKIRPEVKLAPRQIFTREAARADVARIIELYRRQGRFAATVEPKMVQLDQNRVDVVFEITEGAKSKVRQINIIGNEKFSDGQLRGEMATKQSRFYRFFSSGDSYDPDKLSYDQQKMRQFYLTNGYADFRVVSAVAELTPDKRDFIVTYVVEEGDRYKFGDVNLESDIRDVKAETFRYLLPMKKGDWYNAKQIEDTVDSITETTGLLGFTPDVRPDFRADKEALTMDVTFKINDAPRVYVERIDVNGNTLTQDKVVRREFRLAEGDAFNSFRVKRSRDRIQSLGFFQDKFEIERKQGSAPDRVVLEANVQEKSTGELQLSAGYSSLEKFIVDLSITQRNFRGKGQVLRASGSYSTYSKSVELGFTEPYLFDQNIAVGVDIFRRDYNSFNYVNNDRNTTYRQTTTGFQVRAGVPLTEFVQLALRYGLSQDNVTLDRSSFYTDIDNNGVRGDAAGDTCDPLQAGRYLCDAIGRRITSSVGYSLVYSTLNNSIRPTGGQRVVFSQDFAGLGGSVRYIKTKIDADKYWGLGSGFVFSVGIEGGYIFSYDKSRGEGVDKVRLVDRWFLGQPQLRGFDIRGVGPRIQRIPYNADGTLNTGVDRSQIQDDAIGGRAYYLGRAELEIPLGAGARDLGLRPSLFMDAGAVFSLTRPVTLDTRVCDFPASGTSSATSRVVQKADDNNGCPSGSTLAADQSGAFQEVYSGNSPKPRLSVGVGVNWNSPFGPFRIDVAKALLKEPGDDTKLFTFNVGTQF